MTQAIITKVRLFCSGSEKQNISQTLSHTRPALPPFIKPFIKFMSEKIKKQPFKRRSPERTLYFI